MAGSEAVLERLTGWLVEWKAANNPTGELLGGERLERFVREYQNEVARVVDFSRNEIGENARLVLHSGIAFEMHGMKGERAGRPAHGKTPCPRRPAPSPLIAA